MNPPRVLLVEDDASIARFVQLALEELPIELVTCTNVRDAMQALQAHDTRLIITDLMLPGESGIDLVQRLLHEPVPGHPIPVAVFSAGLTPDVRDQLSAMKVWRMLSKPTSVMELEDCVRDALALPAPSQPANLPTEPSAPRPMRKPRPRPRQKRLPPTLRGTNSCSRPTAPVACSSSPTMCGKVMRPAPHRTGPPCAVWRIAWPRCC